MLPIIRQKGVPVLGRIAVKDGISMEIEAYNWRKLNSVVEVTTITKGLKEDKDRVSQQASEFLEISVSSSWSFFLIPG